MQTNCSMKSIDCSVYIFVPNIMIQTICKKKSLHDGKCPTFWCSFEKLLITASMLSSLCFQYHLWAFLKRKEWNAFIRAFNIYIALNIIFFQIFFQFVVVFFLLQIIIILFCLKSARFCQHSYSIYPCDEIFLCILDFI